MEYLYSIDKAIFVFFNQGLSNPVSDMLWPLITDYDKLLLMRCLIAGFWLLLLWKGGKKGRTVALLVIAVILVSDQVSSSVIKQLVQRPRPCHLVDGVPVVQDIRLLVDCGSGKSFPSSHAVNNFAVAILFSVYFPRWKWWFITGASLVALSRVGVGVHYPSDVLAGAIIGTAIAFAMIRLWTVIDRRFLNPGVTHEVTP